jgi:hypothetical protein
MRISLDATTQDVQQIIAESADSVPDEVWQALEATRAFLETQQRLPQFVTSMTGTGGVFQR